MAHPTSVISPNYCAPHPVDLAIVKKVKTGGKFDVIDVEGNVVFKVKEPFSFFRGQTLLLDAAGNPIVTLRPKANSLHRTWKVFRGDSTDSGDLLFSVRRSKIFFQIKIILDVFLSNNTREDVCDFKAKGNFSQRSCVIYAGNSSTIIAQMHEEQSQQSVFFGKDKFMVAVNSNIDYAFIVALTVILYEIDKPESFSSHHSSNHSLAGHC